MRVASTPALAKLSPKLSQLGVGTDCGNGRRWRDDAAIGCVASGDKIEKSLPRNESTASHKGHLKKRIPTAPLGPSPESLDGGGFAVGVSWKELRGGCEGKQIFVNRC